MVSSTAAKSRQLDRAVRRREQILAAARTCVTSDGINGASMGQISAACGMSVGHIYRYFPSKEAIMIALAEAGTMEFVDYGDAMDGVRESSVEAVADLIVAKVPWLLDRSHGAFIAEIAAEAARNPIFADLLERNYARFRSSTRALIDPLLEGLSSEEIDMRVEMVLILTHAVALHANANPSLDRQSITSGYALALRGILSR
jgi:AcrR family transcriptional regulator